MLGVRKRKLYYINYAQCIALISYTTSKKTEILSQNHKLQNCYHCKRKQSEEIILNARYVI